MTIGAAVVISTLNALTLSPALCGLILRKPKEVRRGPLAWFNRTLGAACDGYIWMVAGLIRRWFLTPVIYLALCIAGYALFTSTPTEFIPDEDQGLIFGNVQLPSGASLARTQRVSAQVAEILDETPGVRSFAVINGNSLLSGSGANGASLMIRLAPWSERSDPQQQKDAILASLQQRTATIPEANINFFGPAAIPGLGSVSGFDFRLQAQQGQSPQELAAALRSLLAAANQDPRLLYAFSTYTADVPQIYLDLDREKAELLGVSASDVFSLLQTQLGSRYVNDFNLGGASIASTCRLTSPTATASRTSTGCTCRARRARRCLCNRWFIWSPRRA